MVKPRINIRFKPLLWSPLSVDALESTTVGNVPDSVIVWTTLPYCSTDFSRILQFIIGNTFNNKNKSTMGSKCLLYHVAVAFTPCIQQESPRQTPRTVSVSLSTLAERVCLQTGLCGQPSRVGAGGGTKPARFVGFSSLDKTQLCALAYSNSNVTWNSIIRRIVAKRSGERDILLCYSNYTRWAWVCCRNTASKSVLGNQGLSGGNIGRRTETHDRWRTDKAQTRKEQIPGDSIAIFEYYTDLGGVRFNFCNFKVQH